MLAPGTAVRRARRAAAAVLALYAVLVGTHRGEFWPFSIYPMFSLAGRPWTRAMVRELTPAEAASVSWSPRSLDDLPGVPFALTPHGLYQNDLANYVSKATSWPAERLAGLEAMFDFPEVRERHLLVLKVQGHIVPPDSVAVTATPWVLLSPTGALLSPTARGGP